MDIGKCLTVRFIQGDYQTRQGYKGGGSGQRFYQNGYYHETQGFGWAKCYKPSKLILLVERNEQVYEIWIDYFFKDNVGKLTAKRVNAITNSMPDSIHIHKCETMSGRTYYIADEADLMVWQRAAGL